MENKLFVKVKCSVCRGRKPFSCVYCDMLGESYIQASAKTIARIIDEDPYRDEIVQMLNEGCKNEES